MKTKYINLLIALVVSLITLGFYSCSSDDDDGVLIVEESSNLTLTETDVRVVVGETTTVDIIEGNGDYTAFSLNNEIAEVELVDSKILINAISNGRTTVVVSDKSSQYKQISVISWYDEILLDTTNLEFKNKLGHNGNHTVTVLKGNGMYKTTSDNNEIATASVNQNEITINAFKEGSVNITIKDQFDVAAIVSVKVTETNIPFNQEELDEIVKSSEKRYMYNGDLVSGSGYDYYNYFVNNMNLYGWTRWGNYLQIYFPGNKEVGIKEGSVFTYESPYDSYNKEPIFFEIIKNDGITIWAVFSFIKDGKLVYGYFADTIV